MNEEIQPDGPERDEGERTVLILVVMAVFMFTIGLVSLYFSSAKLGVVEVLKKVWNAIFGSGGTH